MPNSSVASALRSDGSGARKSDEAYLNELSRKMDGPLFITGLGLVTPLGNNVTETWSALLAGRFIRDHARVRLDDAVQRINSLANRAAHEAIEQARWGGDLLRDPATALVIGTSQGPVEAWLSRGAVGVCGLGDLTAAMAQWLGHGCGPRSLLSAACASGLHALIHAVLLLRSGAARRAIVVAAEASVHPLFIGSFKRLGVLAPEGAGCKPFDADRAGFVMSEAAAAICLDTAEEAARPIARIDRVALAADATHLTGVDPQARALRYSIGRVIDGRPIDLVHAHATGTVMNDPLELAAIESALRESEDAPNVYSHKGALGHSLGAAGLVSVVLNCMSHQTGILPPNVMTTRPIESKRAQISADIVRRPVRRSAAIAAGFGGAVAGVSIASS